MSSRYELLSALRELGGNALLQDEPYPVVAPRTVELAAQTLRSAREHQYKVMIIGSGSSFPANFSVLRENVLVVMSVGLMGIEKLSPFVARVMSGTPAAHVMHGEQVGKRTIGGLICDGTGKVDQGLRRKLWNRVRTMDVLTSAGDLQRFSTPSGASLDDMGTANIFVGSAGRLAMICAVELSTPLPITLDPVDEKRMAFDGGTGDAALSSKDAQNVLDPHGLFQW